MNVKELGSRAKKKIPHHRFLMRIRGLTRCSCCHAHGGKKIDISHRNRNHRETFFPPPLIWCRLWQRRDTTHSFVFMPVTHNVAADWIGNVCDWRVRRRSRGGKDKAWVKAAVSSLWCGKWKVCRGKKAITEMSSPEGKFLNIYHFISTDDTSWNSYDCFWID